MSISIPTIFFFGKLIKYFPIIFDYFIYSI
nr:MAG TPA: cytochrome b559 [Crassvirales sp.]